MSSRRLSYYITPAGWIASLISEALPRGGGGGEKRSAESIVSRWIVWDE